MHRLALAAAVLAVASAGCASKTAQNPPPIPDRHMTSTDPSGDAVDSDGNPRHGRPDVDIRRVRVDGNGERVRFTVTAAAKPQGPLRYEVFAEAPEVAGYDVMSAVRHDERATGYISFENSAARIFLSNQSFAAAGRTLAFNLRVDPILGARPFKWRVTLSTASGPKISDVMPSSSAEITSPSGGG
jgi:hypothetical protein